jgi:UMF1 family MFS transporter
MARRGGERKYSLATFVLYWYSARDMSPDPQYRRAIRAWVMYDWANSAFVTTIMAAMYPIFFRKLAIAGGKSDADATALWGYINAISLVLIAVSGPFLGTLADCVPAKKKYFGAFLALGIGGTCFMPFLGDDDYVLAAICFMIANIGWFGANIFYEALLPLIAKPEDLDRVSTRAYATGYLGGGILLILNLLWTQKPEWFGIPDAGTAVRISFASVAIWWGLFSIPFFRNIPEPPCGPRPQNVWRQSVSQLKKTARNIGTFRHVTIFLIAFWIYNDGISTVIKMASVYADEIKIPQTAIISAFVITQFVGIPCAIAFGRLAKRFGAKQMIYLGLWVYVALAAAGYFIQTAAHFYALAVTVALVQGGTQALSRSLFASMIPRSRATEFFSFFRTGSKVAGILGPALFGAIAAAANSSRPAIVSIAIFFIVGMILLRRVDVEKARAVAAEIDAKEARGGEGPAPVGTS